MKSLSILLCSIYYLIVYVFKVLEGLLRRMWRKPGAGGKRHSGRAGEPGKIGVTEGT